MPRELRVRDNLGFSSIVKQAKNLDADLRELVVNALDDAQKEFGIDELSYVRAKLPRKMSQTRKNSTGWIRDLADAMSILGSWHERVANEPTCEERLDWRLAGATLFYFINPFDVIPDHTPASGYIDDAFAFYYCVRNLPEDWVELTDSLDRD